MEDLEKSSTLPRLPESWVVRIFQTMQGTYGTRFLNMWKIGQQLPDGQDAGVVNAMRMWAEQLAGFRDCPNAIGDVLKSLPEDPPALPKFIDLCRQAAKRHQGLTAPMLGYKQSPGDEEKAKEIVKSAKETLKEPSPKNDPLYWAIDLRKRYLQKEVLPTISIKLASEALGEVWRDWKVEK